MNIDGRGSSHTPCGLCHSEDIEELSRRARDGRRHRTTICRRCGLAWANPPPSPSSVRTYYSHEYRQDYKGTRVRTLPQIYHAGLGALARYRAIQTLLTPDKAVLDIGCGGGELVYLLRRLGLNARGIEPDAVYSEQARRDLGLPVQTGFVEDCHFQNGTFDVMLLYHVLEHIDHPVRFLARLRPWLADAGFLLVEVPNIEATGEAPVTKFHVAHLHYFNPDTLEAVARAAGFGVHEMRVSADGGTMTGIFSAGPAAEVEAPPADSQGAYDRIKSILSAHTNRRYYLSPTPYSRMWARLRTYWRNRTIARRFAGGRDLLDALFATASRQLERR